MKIGDLVAWKFPHNKLRIHHQDLGIIIGPPLLESQRAYEVSGTIQWEVHWYNSGKTDWCDEDQLEVVSENR